MGKPQYTQKFRSEWVKEHRFEKWLTRVEGDDSKCYCKFCKVQLAAKLCDLEKHRNTNKHKKASEPFNSPIQPKILFNPVNNETKLAEAKASLFIAEHCSFKVTDHLCDLCKSCFADSKAIRNFKLHRTKCSAIVCNVLAPHFEMQLKVDIGDSGYSLLLDESTDFSVTKLLGIVIRYYSLAKKSIVSTYLAVVELTDCTADGIVSTLKQCLQVKGLNLFKLLAIGTDNASVMIGVNKGVFVKLRQEIPHLQLIKCVCHSLHLAISHATAEFLPRNLDFLIRETYNWFSHSATRQLTYKELYRLINDGEEPLKLVQVCQTRWLSIELAVSRILQQWTELKAHFGIVRSRERCYSAEILYEMYGDRQNYVLLIFLKPVLREVQTVNKKFQSQNPDPTKLIGDLLLLIKSLATKIVMPGKNLNFITAKLEDHLDPHPYVGYQFETEMSASKFSPEVRNQMRTRCVNFVLGLINQLRQRLPENIDILQDIALFSPDECLKRLKRSIVHFAKLFVTDADVLTRVDFQWKNLSLIHWSEVTDCVKFWTEVSLYMDSTGQNPFRELVNVAFAVLSLPHSNAEVERIFSCVNITKTKLRNRMKVQTLHSLLCVKFGLKREGKCCYSYEIPKELVQKIGTLDSYQREDKSTATTSTAAGCSYESDDEDFII